MSYKLWHTMFMVATSVTMPDLDTLQPEALKAIIVAQQLQILSNDNEIEHLKLLVAKLRRMQFGRRSEKVTRQIEQLELKLEELEANRAEDAAQTESQPPATAASSLVKTADRRRRPLPEHLPRKVQTHMPAVDNCPDCGGTLKKLGEDASEVLEYIPASFVVIRHVRPRMCCSRCDTILQAPAPSRPVERGLAGPGLLAHVLTAKFCDHLPLFRQSDIYAREGVDLERYTLAKWVGDSSKLLDPLIEALRRYVMAAEKLHGDERGPHGQVFVRGVGIRPCLCLRPATARLKPADCGHTFAMIALRDRWMLRRLGSLTRPTAEENIRNSIWPSSKAFCRPTHSLVLTSSTGMEPSKKLLAWRIFAASFMTWSRRISRRLPSKRWNASPPCMRLKKRFADGLRNCGKKCAAKKHGLCWMQCTSGSKSLWQNSRPSLSRPARFAMRLHCGMHCSVTVTMAESRSTTTRPKEPCEPLLLADEIISLRAPMQVANALLPSIH